MTNSRIARMAKTCSALSATALFTAACVSAAPPIPEMDSSLLDKIAETAPAFEAETTTPDWWSRFDDTDLVRRVEQALNHNKSLAAADANVRQAQALLQREALGRSPSTSGSVNASFAEAPNSNRDAEVSLGGALGASWEFDAFGRISAEIASAEFDLLAAEQSRRDVAVIIASETALAHVDLRGSQKRLQVARQNAKAQRESLDLLQKLLDNGRATQLDFERARAQYHTTLASLPGFEAQIANAASRLTALTGDMSFVSPSYLDAAISDEREIPIHTATLFLSTPIDALRRHPDVRQAEAVIASRLALSEAERTRLFPTLRFDASLLASTNETNDFSLTDAFGFSLGPVLSWEGPDLRRVRADIDVSDARARAAMADYEQILLDVFSEVESALWSYRKELERRTDLVQAATSARRATELARLRFEEGLDDYLDVIDSQRTLLNAEDQLADSHLQSARKAIAVYRALGGIWSAEELETLRNTPTESP